MQNSHTTTTTRSDKNRLGTSLKWILIGGAIIIGAIGMIFVNERNQAQKVRHIVEIEPVKNLEYENAVVYLSGQVTSNEIITDDLFNISLENALYYRREVEMYQWQETTSEKTKDKARGTQEVVTTRAYDKTWSSTFIDSQYFDREGYENPDAFPVESLSKTVGQASMGEIELSKGMISMSVVASYHNYTPVALSLGYTKEDDGYLYTGDNYNKPEIGDIRIQFEYSPEGTFSMIGMYNDGVVSEYINKKNTLGIVGIGETSIQELKESEYKTPRTIGWILRGVAFVMMFIGMVMVFGPLERRPKIVPTTGRIIGMVSKSLLFFVALILSLVTASVAWVMYRPVIGGILIAGTLGIIFLTWKGFKKNEVKNTPDEKGV